MVRLSSTLFRVPVIKFRKGGGSHAGTPPSSSTATPAPAAAAAPSPGQTQQTASMSTISDMDLPPRYRRTPLTQEEIDHINGGGIEQSDSDKNDNKLDTVVFNMPKNVVLHCKKPARKLMKPPSRGCNVYKAK